MKFTMIFVTVGTDHAFDRLMKAVDKWAANHGRHDLYAQIGHDGWEPTFIPFCNMMPHAEVLDHIRSSSLVISHAGMGTILTALHFQKSILVMPKLATLGEHRNEHQTATCRKLQALPGVNVAFDDHELIDRLNQAESLTKPSCEREFSDEVFLMKIRKFIFCDEI